MSFPIVPPLKQITFADSPYTPAARETVYVDSTAGNVIVSFDNAVEVTVKKTSLDTNLVVVSTSDGNGLEKPDAGTLLSSIILAIPSESATWRNDGSNYRLHSEATRPVTDTFLLDSGQSPFPIPALAAAIPFENAPLGSFPLFTISNSTTGTNNRLICNYAVTIQFDWGLIVDWLYVANNSAINLTFTPVTDSTDSQNVMPSQPWGKPTASRTDQFQDSAMWFALVAFAVGEYFELHVNGVFNSASADLDGILLTARVVG